MSDICRRLAEIRDRVRFARKWTYPNHDAEYLLDLIDRLLEFVPVPKIKPDGSYVECEWSFRIWNTMKDLPSSTDDLAVLTACEVHGITPPDWLVERAIEAERIDNPAESAKIEPSHSP